jgi:hypothetical protein
LAQGVREHIGMHVRPFCRPRPKDALASELAGRDTDHPRSAPVCG